MNSSADRTLGGSERPQGLVQIFKAGAIYFIVATILAARFVVERFAFPPMPGIRLGVGFVALGFLLIAEFTVVLPLRGLTIDEHFASRDPMAETVYITMLGVFAVMPFLVAHRWDR